MTHRLDRWHLSQGQGAIGQKEERYAKENLRYGIPFDERQLVGISPKFVTRIGIPVVFGKRTARNVNPNRVALQEKVANYP